MLDVVEVVVEKVMVVGRTLFQGAFSRNSANTSLRESRWCSLRPQRLGVPEVKTREDLEREVEYNVYACCHFKRLNQRARQDSRSAHGGCCRPGLKVAATRLNVHGSSPKLPHIKSKAQYVGMFKLITGWIVEIANPEQI